MGSNPVVRASGEQAGVAHDKRARGKRPRGLPNNKQERAVIGRALGALVPRAMAGGNRRAANERLQALGAWHTRQRVTIGECSYDVWGLPTGKPIAEWIDLLAPYGVSVEHSQGSVLDVARGAGIDTRRAKAVSRHRALDREALGQHDLDATASHFELGAAPRVETLVTLPTDQIRIWRELVQRWRHWSRESRQLACIDKLQTADLQSAAEQLASMPLLPPTLSASKTKPIIRPNTAMVEQQLQAQRIADDGRILACEQAKDKRRLRAWLASRAPFNRSR